MEILQRIGVSAKAIARGLLPLVLAALLACSACGGDEPTLARSPLPTPSLSGVIAFENAVRPGVILSTAAPLRSGNGDIYVVHADGSGLRALAEDPSWAEHPSWSPDASRIVWATYPADSESGTYATLWVMNADGSDKQPLAEGVHGDWAVWSPDGTQLAFSRFGENVGVQQICVIDADGSGLRELTQGSGDVAPAWGPDDRIYFLRSSKIYAMNPDGSGVTQVTKGYDISDFGLSPDGKTLAIHDYANDRILAVAVDGSGSPTTLLDRPSRYLDPEGKLGTRWAPAWTPDGKALVLTTDLPYSLHGTRLYVVNADGSGLSAVPGIENAIDAAWRPE
jgi:Tol biopolymer transport system component